MNFDRIACRFEFAFAVRMKLAGDDVDWSTQGCTYAKKIVCVLVSCPTCLATVGPCSDDMQTLWERIILEATVRLVDEDQESKRKSLWTITSIVHAASTNHESPWMIHPKEPEDRQDRP